MSLPRPTYDAKDLQLFLHAHVMRAGALATDLPPSMRDKDPARRDAERGERARIRAEARVSVDVLALAWAGREINPEHARRLWMAMGIDPKLSGDAR